MFFWGVGRRAGCGFSERKQVVDRRDRMVWETCGGQVFVCLCVDPLILGVGSLRGSCLEKVYVGRRKVVGLEKGGWH